MAREVQVGDTTYKIQPFNGRKAIIAGRIMGRIGRAVPELIALDATFQADYAESHAVRITRGMAETPLYRDDFTHMTPEAWDGIGGVITLPQAPPDELRIANAFSVAFERAEDEVVKLLGLLVIPNSRLSEADDPAEALKEQGNTLLDEGEFGELIELAAAGADQLRDTFEARDTALGKLRRLWGRNPEAPAATTTDGTSPTPGSSSDDAPSGSTSSPAPTDGESDAPSTEHASDSLQPSLSG